MPCFIGRRTESGLGDEILENISEELVGGASHLGQVPAGVLLACCWVLLGVALLLLVLLGDAIN